MLFDHQLLQGFKHTVGKSDFVLITIFHIFISQCDYLTAEQSTFDPQWVSSLRVSITAGVGPSLTLWARVCSWCQWLLLHQRQTCWKLSDQRYAASNNQQHVSQSCERPGWSPVAVWRDLFCFVFVTGCSGVKPVDITAAGWKLNTTDLFFVRDVCGARETFSVSSCSSSSEPQNLHLYKRSFCL